MVPRLFARALAAALACLGWISRGLAADAPEAVALPDGVRAVWDLGSAFRESTATRERVCLNGLWLWQPETPANAGSVPDAGWGWFKVPGPWPGITDYMQKDSQSVIVHPAWASVALRTVSSAWHQRRFTVPADWLGRRVTLRAEYLHSLAEVFIDGRRAGELRFPGGELDITAHCPPGTTHTLALRVVALPLKGVLLAYTDSAAAREVSGSVARRGLCGDVFLEGTPYGPRLEDLRMTTSVKDRTVTFDAAIEDLPEKAHPRLKVRITRDGRLVADINGPEVRRAKLVEGRIGFTVPWLPDALWDIHTPGNQFDVTARLEAEDGTALDVAWPVRTGFRELRIEGRDFVLNGKPLQLSAVPLDNAQISAGLATYAAARETMERLRSFGINFVYTHNYGCEPGSHLAFGEILRAADDVGMLVAFSQPHFSHYEWASPDADRTNGYARHAAFYVRAAQDHPSVVFHAMSHNATGYNGDMNPDLIDGVQEARDNWARRNVEKALRAEAIVRRLDPGRIVYHHASGNLGPMHVVNFYPNFTPVQELSDWFGHWAEAGVKPLFTCEYGAPFTWDWTLYRGWYDGRREFGSATVPWEFCVAEWNAQFFGDIAYQVGEPEKANLRWEARQLREGRVWHRWDYPSQVGSDRFTSRYPVFAKYIEDNWRAFRTWGVSATSPWEYGHFWKTRDGVDRRRQALSVDWEHLQRPGFSPDFVGDRMERMDVAFDRADWIATPAAEALLRNNLPLLGYIAGPPGRFTAREHNVTAGEAVTRQLIVLNNSREPVDCNVRWAVDGGVGVSGAARVTVGPGAQQRLPVSFTLPTSLATGRIALTATFDFGPGGTQSDSFTLDLLPPAPPAAPAGKIGLFDPRGETRTLLEALGVGTVDVAAGDDLAGLDVLVIGRRALTPDGPAPDISRVRDGLKVLVFEQSSETLERRLGFRVQEYGLRQAFPRVPDHPVVAGLDAEHLRDWRGEATLLPPRLETKADPAFNGAPTVTWCGIQSPRLWRCGNRGNVASVLIEKPQHGDFLPIIDGGFGLQYSPLLECREGRGLVVFCQLDVTGRTAQDPAAALVVSRLLRHVSTWTRGPRRTVAYAGNETGLHHLRSAGFPLEPLGPGGLGDGQVLVLGPGAAKAVADHRQVVSDRVRSGSPVLALALGADDLPALLPASPTVRQAEHIATHFDPPSLRSPFAGIAPADVHNRDPRDLPLVVAGADALGDGVLAAVEGTGVVLCQMAPWQFGPPDRPNLRRTQRRVEFVVSRILGNLGVPGRTPLLDRFHRPVDASSPARRWEEGYYLGAPHPWDDPYRFFRW